MNSNEKFMLRAIKLSKESVAKNGGPFGCIIVKDGKIIAEGRNLVTKNNDPTAHAEIIAISSATNTLKDWRLTDCSLYVTKEPCFMCSGALMNSRMKFVGFGIYDEKEGCCGSVYQLCNDLRFQHQVLVKGGILEQSCKLLIKNFFINCRL